MARYHRAKEPLVGQKRADYGNGLDPVKKGQRATGAYELLESTKSGEAELDLDVAIGWIQRAICLIGNANMAVSAERRKAILLKIDLKLATMAISEPGPSAEGMLFGDNFVKDLGSYVKTGAD
ncbi:Hypothetical predicted protein [Pelobates cultripes]|uniref:Uncharacterized protein n=1 Tax=Pelobates cultripes TaxID=61616 RepID=A0AAD1SGL6_PELCU|nr:Hypothetical predicted protein [Pelobates cultripes]